MVAPVLKSFQAEVRPKARDMSQRYFLVPAPVPPGVARGGQQPLCSWEKLSRSHRSLPHSFQIS